MKKSLIIILICFFCLCGCGKIPKLANGEEAVITFSKGDNEHKISANELYELLKSDFGLTATVDMIDKYIFETEFSEYAETAKKTADTSIESMISSYGDENTLLEALRYYTNYQSIDAYKNAMYINSLRTHATEEYAKSLVTDEEIEDYYNNESKGDIEVYHILVTPKVTDSMTTTEKTEAEDAAKKTIDEIIKKLDEAENKLETFKSLVKEYSEDESTKDKDGNLGYINYYQLGTEYDELIDAAYKLKDGEYSKNVITTELGYHVVYRNASKEKDTLENLKDSIKEIIADKKTENDTKMQIKALKYYRELYNLEIIDSEINKQYGVDLNAQLNAQENDTSAS